MRSRRGHGPRASAAMLLDLLSFVAVAAAPVRLRPKALSVEKLFATFNATHKENDRLRYGDKDLIADPKVSEPMKRHALEELHDLEVYVDHHHEEIEAGDHHDPNVLELFCEMHPDEPECLVYDD